MKEVLNKIITNSRWQYPIFNEKIIVEGRILSPSESEICGLSSALIAKSIMSNEQIKQISQIQNDEVTDQDDIEKVFKILESFEPDKILQMNESQDKILCQCVRRASIDKGVSWQNFTFVLDEKNQCSLNNRLWIGMIEDSDRKKMIELCMQGHKKATESIRRLL